MWMNLRAEVDLEFRRIYAEREHVGEMLLERRRARHLDRMKGTRRDLRTFRRVVARGKRSKLAAAARAYVAQGAPAVAVETCHCGARIERREGVRWAHHLDPVSGRSVKCPT